MTPTCSREGRSRDSVTISRAVGRELRRLRLRAGMTQDEVALHCDTYKAIVGRAERGKHEQSLDTCDRFSRACGGGIGHVFVAMDRALGVLP